MFWFNTTCWILFTFTRVAARSVLRDRQGPDVVKVFVTEGDDVILPCSLGPNVNIEATVFDWKKDNKEVFMFDNGKYYGNGLSGQDQDFKGQVSHFDEELKQGNASILLRGTRITDSGNFTCIFPHLGSGQRYRIELVVVLEPNIKILGETKEGVQLQCSVRGASPKPDVHWQDGDEKIVPAEEPQVSEREGRYDIILQTTVTKTDIYRCVSTQEEIHHQIYTETYVPVPDAGGMVPVWVVVSAAVVAVFLTLLVWVIVSEFYFVLKKKTHSAVPTNPRFIITMMS
ncbi:butyrophilin-like protein 2 [Pleuronectes platessa]|uniref:butyrophilin-like protein 2 n=1 Tax=Pleuronectes platessa TaxID=8262 RepID=UPI00232A34A6|nr:butyrophilin-like protein 2 [Pleuronectes platessa]